MNNFKDNTSLLTFSLLLYISFSKWYLPPSRIGRMTAGSPFLKRVRVGKKLEKK